MGAAGPHGGPHPRRRTARRASQSGDTAVWNALWRTAASANGRGWHQTDWEGLVRAPGQRLGEQAGRRGGNKFRTPRQIAELLDKVWTSADKWREEQGPAKTRDEMRRQGNERARIVLDIVESPAALLTDPERAVLAHAARTALAHNSRGKALDRVALPRAEMRARTGLGLTALRTTLRRLEGRGLLALVEQGLPRGPRGKACARQRLRPARTGGGPGPASSSTGRQVCGAPGTSL